MKVRLFQYPLPDFKTSDFPIIFISLFGCGKSVKIGYMGGMTGRLADLGISGRNGTELAIEEFNRTGGIRNMEVELIIADDKQEAETAEAEINRLIDLDISGLVGPMTSDMSLAILPVLNEAGIPMISPTASTGELTAIDDQFLRVNPPDLSESISLAGYAYRNLCANKVMVIYDIDNRSFTEGLYSAFQEQFSAFSATEVDAVVFDSKNSPDLFTTAQSAMEQEPEAVLLIASSLDAALLCQNIRKIASDIPIMATGWSMTDDFITHGGENVEGVIFSHYFDENSRNPKYLEFVETYKARYGDTPDFFAMLAYNAVLVMRSGLENKNEDESLKDAIVRLENFEGLQGEIFIDQFGDCELERHFLVIQNGKLEQISNAKR